MHYRGLLRIAGRASGVRTYAVQAAAHDAPAPELAMDAPSLVLGILLFGWLARQHPAHEGTLSNQ